MRVLKSKCFGGGPVTAAVRRRRAAKAKLMNQWTMSENRKNPGSLKTERSAMLRPG